MQFSSIGLMTSSATSYKASMGRIPHCHFFMLLLCSVTEYSKILASYLSSAVMEIVVLGIKKIQVSYSDAELLI